MILRARILCSALGGVLLLSGAVSGQEPAVRVEPPSAPGAPFSGQAARDFSVTKTAVVRDYLEAWRNFRAAFEQNQADLLARSFVGGARDTLAAAIAQQASLGLRTHYLDRSHDLQIVFYRPGGGSLEMTDSVEYEQQTLNAHGDCSGIRRSMHATRSCSLPRKPAGRSVYFRLSPMETQISNSASKSTDSRGTPITCPGTQLHEEAPARQSLDQVRAGATA